MYNKMIAMINLMKAKQVLYSYSSSVRFAILTLVLTATALGSTAASDKLQRPSFHGFEKHEIEMPYPVKLETEIPDRRPPYLQATTQVMVDLLLDKKGKVKEVDGQNSEDSLLISYFENNLLSYRFAPAQIEGQKSEWLLPVKLLFVPGRKLPDISFPVDTLGEIADRSLYLLSLEKNGVSFARIKEFPSYFCDVEWNDSLDLLPFVLFKVSLDEKGTLVSTESVFSNRPGFEQQLRSAALYASFTPLMINGQPRATDCYLFVSLFPQISYPTDPFHSDLGNGNRILEQYRLQLLPDTVGLLAKPFPRIAPPDTVTIAGDHGAFVNTVVALLSIDSLGDASIVQSNTKSPQLRQGLRRFANTVRFFPAMDHSGSPVSFRGWVRVQFPGSTKLRIEYFWL